MVLLPDRRRGVEGGKVVKPEEGGWDGGCLSGKGGVGWGGVGRVSGAEGGEGRRGGGGMEEVRGALGGMRLEGNGSHQEHAGWEAESTFSDWDPACGFFPPISVSTTQSGSPLVY